MTVFRIVAVALTVVTLPALADLRDIIPEETLKFIAQETSGEAAKRNLDTITLQHRMRTGRQFAVASRHIAERLRHYGIDSVELLRFPADGETMFGTQKSRPVWEVEFAELWELAEVGTELQRQRRIGNWDAMPLTLAQDSLAANVKAELVDIGTGIDAASYNNISVRGKFVLTSSQPEAVVDIAVGEHGAAGIISYAPNQKSAWWKLDDQLVRWGHLSSFPATESFAFMISLGEARKFQQRLVDGEEILLHARVDARHEDGEYAFVTAAIHGTNHAQEEIHFTCHLDHPRPGANDNASGCVAILETARTLNALIKSGAFPRPARTIRFLWPPEIEGSIMYLAGHENPRSIKANIHMDMVGGGPQTKAIYRISGGPMSVPSFVADLGHEIGKFVNEQTEKHASGAEVEFPLIAPEGGKEPLMALLEGISMGSDHDVFFEGTWAIPGIYLHDWPDRYIHTNYDLAANIDPSKLKRSAFIGATAAWYLANMSNEDVPAILSLLKRNAISRSADLLDMQTQLGPQDQRAVGHVHFDIERRKLNSIARFAEADKQALRASLAFIEKLQRLTAPANASHEASGLVYERNDQIKGPMRGFGYSYVRDTYGKAAYAELQLPKFSFKHASGAEYVYEALNLVDGVRGVNDIRNWLTAEFGPVPVEYVAEYLAALASIDVVRIRQ